MPISFITQTTTPCAILVRLADSAKLHPIHLFSQHLTKRSPSVLPCTSESPQQSTTEHAASFASLGRLWVLIRQRTLLVAS